MTLRPFLYSTAVCMLLSTPLHAATVTLTVNGSTNESDGSLIYTPGSAFTAVAVFDDAFADGNADPNTGFFFDLGTATTALTSFELTTEFGTVRYVPANVTGTVIAPQVGQIASPNQQTFNVTSHIGGGVVGNGWSGAMGALLPDSFTFTISASGLGDYLFTDPNTLLSGAAGGLDSDFDLYAGAITLADSRFLETTDLFFGAGDVTITSSATPPVSTVPLPASLPMLVFGLFGLGCAAMRKSRIA
ncbi:hypothetical protein KHP62_05005 [Rhodobacteraceae bacterium NNCM2]|nr:hypothetical protein [Coraliihabitans acroporae]